MEGPSRYLIGIDLGTTNSAVAFVDTRESANEADSSGIRIFEVAQLTSPGEVRAVPLLPSFLYFPIEDEVSSGTVRLPWEEHPFSIVGMMARDQGALVPGGRYPRRSHGCDSVPSIEQQTVCPATR